MVPQKHNEKQQQSKKNASKLCLKSTYDQYSKAWIISHQNMLLKKLLQEDRKHGSIMDDSSLELWGLSLILSEIMPKGVSVLDL